MSLSSVKSGSHFGTVNASGVLSPAQIADLIVKAANQLGISPTIQLVSQGVGTVMAESGGDPKNPGDGTHIGMWQEEESFGTRAERLDAYQSTVKALQRWKSDGGTFYNGWTAWETGEAEGTGVDRAPRYAGVAKAAIEHGGNSSGSGKDFFESLPLVGGLAHEIEGGAETVLGAGEFLVEMAETLLDFRKLGQLAVEAFAWFLRLLLKALWDYVVAPLWHWAERAETFYFRNFFGTGTEPGSGFGHVLRENAGIITIAFWSLGYAILWSDGESLAPTEAHDSMLGRAVKGIEGSIARRNLIKPSRVRDETPAKPKPKSSSVAIEQVTELGVSRKRPVTVSGPGIDSSGRNQDVSSEGHRVPRPQKNSEQKQTESDEGPKIIIPSGVAA